jgi:uncharacterized membrane protein YdjX (TVP38/TMEM64 family)
MLASLKGYLLSAIGLIAAVVGIFYAGRKAGRDAVKVKQAAKTLKHVKEANEIDSETNRLSDDELNARLRPYQRK